MFVDKGVAFPGGIPDGTSNTACVSEHLKGDWSNAVATPRTDLINPGRRRRPRPTRPCPSLPRRRPHQPGVPVALGLRRVLDPGLPHDAVPAHRPAERPVLRLAVELRREQRGELRPPTAPTRAGSTCCCATGRSGSCATRSAWRRGAASAAGTAARSWRTTSDPGRSDKGDRHMMTPHRFSVPLRGGMRAAPGRGGRLRPRFPAAAGEPGRGPGGADSRPSRPGRRGSPIDALARRTPRVYFNDPKCRSDVQLLDYKLDDGHTFHGQSVRDRGRAVPEIPRRDHQGTQDGVPGRHDAGRRDRAGMRVVPFTYRRR